MYAGLYFSFKHQRKTEVITKKIGSSLWQQHTKTLLQMKNLNSSFAAPCEFTKVTLESKQCNMVSDLQGPLFGFIWAYTHCKWFGFFIYIHVLNKNILAKTEMKT